MRETTAKTLLFRQNINRTNAEWARFLENYRTDLIEWLQTEYHVDWHTAEDIVSELYLEIIQNSHILNLRPDDSFRHTLICLCKQKYTRVVRPWRRKLTDKICETIRLFRLKKNTPVEELALGFIDLVVNDLLDETKDNARPYTEYSPKDLDRWRRLWKADANFHPKDLARLEKVTARAVNNSCKKVNDAIAGRVRQIMTKHGFKWSR